MGITLSASGAARHQDKVVSSLGHSRSPNSLPEQPARPVPDNGRAKAPGHRDTTARRACVLPLQHIKHGQVATIRPSALHRFPELLVMAQPALSPQHQLGIRSPTGLHRQPLAPFSPPALKDRASLTGPHPGDKAVHSLAAARLRLICPLHKHPLLVTGARALHRGGPTALYLGQNWPVKELKPLVVATVNAANDRLVVGRDGRGSRYCSLVYRGTTLLYLVLLLWGSPA